jgi:hypothetical protein
MTRNNLPYKCQRNVVSYERKGWVTYDLLGSRNIEVKIGYEWLSAFLVYASFVTIKSKRTIQTRIRSREPGLQYMLYVHKCFDVNFTAAKYRHVR